jgi:hypothetical protein
MVKGQRGFEMITFFYQAVQLAELKPMTLGF